MSLPKYKESTFTGANYPPCENCRSNAVVFVKERRELKRFEEQKYQLRCNECGHRGMLLPWVTRPMWRYRYTAVPEPKPKKERPKLTCTFERFAK